LSQNFEHQGDILYVERQNKSIVLALKEGWGTVVGWEKVWDELLAPHIILHFAVGLSQFVGWR